MLALMVRIRRKVSSKIENNSVYMMNAEEKVGLSLKREEYEGMRVCITLPQVILYKSSSNGAGIKQRASKKFSKKSVDSVNAK